MYTAAIQDSHRVSWNEFCTTFHKHHIPVRTIHYSLREFLDLQQGTDNVSEYIRKLNYREQYSTHHIDTDEKKVELFRRGLSLPLQDRLVRFRDMPFNALVTAAIDHEGTCRAVLAEEEKMRKRVMLRHSEDSYGSAPPKYRQVTISTSTTTVGSPPTSTAAGVAPHTYPDSAAYITSCISAKNYSSQHPVFQLWTCRALCSVVS
jgi:hypothetical protein